MNKTRKDKTNHVLLKYEHLRKNGTYEYRYPDKNRKRHSIYAKSLVELREKKSRVLQNLSNGIKNESSMVITDLYKRWESLKLGVKDNTLQNYKYLYAQYIEPYLGNVRLSVLKRSDIREFCNMLYQKKGLSIHTIDDVHNVLSQILQLGVEDEYLSQNHAKGATRELKRLCDGTEKRRAMTVAEQSVFEDFLMKEECFEKWQNVFLVFLWTGLRVSELAGLRWCDVDFDKNILYVNHTLVYYKRGEALGCGFVINTPKSKAGYRAIPMLSRVREALLMERKRQRAAGIQCQMIVDGYTDFIFLNRFGRPYHQGTLNKALKRIIAAFNLQNPGQALPCFTNHSLRHTFATRLCEANVNIKVIQAVMGHSEIELTLNVYADATESFMQSELTNLEKYHTALRSRVD